MKEEIEPLLARRGQQHLLAFWDQLDQSAQESLCRQIRAVDLDLAGAALSRARPAGRHPRAGRAGGPAAGLPPRRRGESLLAGKRSAAAAARRWPPERSASSWSPEGRAPAWDSTIPRACFPSGRCPAGRCSRSTSRRSWPSGGGTACGFRLYLMTSPATHAETVDFLARHDRFGLAEDDLQIFCQGTMPVVDAASGRILLEAPGRLAASPDGHGGMLAAFAAQRLPGPRPAPRHPPILLLPGRQPAEPASAAPSTSAITSSAARR